MTSIIEPETPRLQLRQWRASDRSTFAALTGDPRVMEFFPQCLSRAESDKMADLCEQYIAERGWGFWAAELKATGEFIGFVGLHVPAAELPFSPCVEIGWRLAAAHWRNGYATEAASAALDAGFSQLGLEDIVSFAVVANNRSRAVMQRLGMSYSGDFDHPQVTQASLRRHCLYRLSRQQWSAGTRPVMSAD